jgi:hypothetical protein
MLQTRFPSVLALITAAVLTFDLAPARAEKVEGVVIDGGKTAPNNGIPAASVKIEHANGATFHSTSAGDGSYEFLNIPLGGVTVIVSKRGFVRDPTDVPKTVGPGNNRVNDAILWRPTETQAAYFAVAARGILIRAAQADDKQSALTSEWVYITAANIPLTFKWRLAKALSDEKADVKDLLPVVQAYNSVGLEAIEKVEGRFAASAGDVSQWPQGALSYAAETKIPPNLFADAILSTLYVPSFSLEKRKALAKKLEVLGAINPESFRAFQPWTELPDINGSVKDPAKKGTFEPLFRVYKEMK